MHPLEVAAEFRFHANPNAPARRYGMADPATYPPRVLLAATGLIQQIVTETLYARSRSRRSPIGDIIELHQLQSE